MRRKRIYRSAFVLGLFFLSWPMFVAKAVEEKKQEVPKKKVKTIYKKSETHKFSGKKLKGQLKKPEMSYIYQRKGLRAEKIVNIPEDFNDEITEGAKHF